MTIVAHVVGYVCMYVCVCVCNAMQCSPNRLDGTNPLHPSLPPLQNACFLYTPILSYPRSKRVRSNISRVVPPHATIHVDIAVSEAADREHHAVRVERRAGDRARPRGREEGGVRLDSVDGCAGDVEEGEGVRVGAAVWNE